MLQATSDFITAQAARLEARRINLRALCVKHTARRLAELLGYGSSSYISQMCGPNSIRPVGEEVARKIEHVLGLPDGWMDQPHGAQADE